MPLLERGGQVQRRIFLTLVGSAAAWSLAAGAQQADKLPTIGFLGLTTDGVASESIIVFERRLRELGRIKLPDPCPPRRR